MLSYHAIGASHDMHAERPVTIDRCSGTRAATTFRKLPSARPGRNAIAAAAASISRTRRGQGPDAVSEDDVVPEAVLLLRISRRDVDGEIDGDRLQLRQDLRAGREDVARRQVIGPLPPRTRARAADVSPQRVRPARSERRGRRTPRERARDALLI